MSSHIIVIPVCTADLPSSNRFPCLNSRFTPRTILLRSTLQCTHIPSSFLSTHLIYPPSQHMIYPPIYKKPYTRDRDYHAPLLLFMPRRSTNNPCSSESSVHSLHLCLHRYTTSVTVLYPVLICPSIPEESRAIIPIVIPRPHPRSLL